MDDFHTIVAFFAHPDDESFAAGGTLARFHARGARVILVCATDGRQGGKGMRHHVTPSQMKKLRKKEMQKSASLLGIYKLVCWHYHDKKLHRVSPKNIRSRIIHVLNVYHPDLVITFGKGGISGHSDHKAISRFTTGAFRAWKLKTTSRLWHAALSQQAKNALHLSDKLTPVPNVTVSIKRFAKAKIASIQIHRTQVFTRSRVGIRGERAHPDFFRHEYFYQVSPRIRVPQKL